MVRSCDGSLTQNGAMLQPSEASQLVLHVQQPQLTACGIFRHPLNGPPGLTTGAPPPAMSVVKAKGRATSETGPILPQSMPIWPIENSHFTRSMGSKSLCRWFSDVSFEGPERSTICACLILRVPFFRLDRETKAGPNPVHP